jgi:hypothetical protein
MSSGKTGRVARLALVGGACAAPTADAVRGNLATLLYAGMVAFFALHALLRN